MRSPRPGAEAVPIMPPRLLITIAFALVLILCLATLAAAATA